MKTKLFSFFFVLIISTGTILASDIQINGIYYNLDDNNQVAEVTYQGTSYNAYENRYIDSIVIPSSVTYNGVNYRVTSIGAYAFYHCWGLTSVTIPNSITNIGNSAFANCKGLISIIVESGNLSYDSRNDCNAIIKSATNELLFGCQNTIIPNTVTSIGDSAFFVCTNLKDIAIPNSVTNIGENAFYYCSGLTSISIPNSVTSIKKETFANCRGLTSVRIPSSIKNIEQGAFSDCYGLINVEIPNGVTDIGRWAFYSCSSLTNITIPNSVTHIEVGVFAGCSNLTSITIPNTVTHIEASVFARCISLASIEIPNSVTSIGNNAFNKCSSLRFIELPSSVANIEDYAFSDCSNLASITILTDCEHIGSDVFYNCKKLTTVIWNARSAVDFTASMTPFYNKSSTKKYDIRGQITTFIIGDAVEYVPAYLCDGMENISTLSVGNSVKSIGGRAFSGLTNRKVNKLVLPNTLKTIGFSAFAGDSYIESIYFGPSLESIGSKAFDGCTRVATMTCLANVTPTVGTNGLESINSNATLYVPSSCLQKYKVDTNWNRFIIEPLGTSDVLDPGTDVSVIADDNSAIFIWPTNASAQSYTLVLTKDGETVCTLTFNGNGQLAGISFAPSANSQAHMPSAIMTTAGMQFTVTGLSYATNYEYALTVKDGSSNILASYSGSFGTTGAPQAIDNVSAIQGESTKLLRNGQILILRGNRTYTLTGQELK